MQEGMIGMIEKIHTTVINVAHPTCLTYNATPCWFIIQLVPNFRSGWRTKALMMNRGCIATPNE